MLRAAAALAVLCALSAAPAAGQAIAGRVIDAASGGGVPRARVAVGGVGHEFERETTTGVDGSFSVAVRGAGTYRLRVSREGYREAQTRQVAVGASETAHVAVQLSSAAFMLDTLQAVRRRRRLDVPGYFREVVDSLKADSLAARGFPVSANGRWLAAAVEGSLVVPNTCYRLAGAAERTGSTVTVNVQARPTGEPCPTFPRVYTYKLTVRGLPAGRYTLRVLHTWRGAAWEPQMALDTTVTVR